MAVVAMCIAATGNPSTFSFSTIDGLQKKRPKVSAPVPSETESLPENYFPLHAGNFWLYRARVEIGNEKGGTDKIDKPRRVQVISNNGDDKRRIVHLKTDDYNGSNLITYSISNGKIYQFDEFDKADAEKQTDLPDDKLRYVFPLSVNKKWREPESSTTKNGLYSYVVDSLEEITVPAGTFHGCYRIVFRTIADESVEWFFPNVGIVKSTYHHNGSVDDELYELESYKIGAETKPVHPKGHNRK